MQRFQRQGIEMPQENISEGIKLDEAVYTEPKPEKKQEVSKQITMQLALDEVQRFKKEHKRMPKKEEYDKIAESIYTQLKDKEKRKKILERLDRLGPKESPAERAKARKKHGKGKGPAGDKAAAFAELHAAAKELNQKETIGANQKELQNMSVQDLFSDAKQSKKTVGNEEDEFSLGAMSKFEGKAEDEFSLGELSSIEEPESQAKGNKCPKCGNLTDDIIFCSECGTAFCEKCAKRVSTQGAVKTFVCPDCGKKTKK